MQIITILSLPICHHWYGMPSSCSCFFLNKNYLILMIVISCQYTLIQHLLLGYIPKNSWSMDPFGHSPTWTYLLRRSGIEAMVIQRTHYAVKKHLAFKKQIEFLWQQSWGTSSSVSFEVILVSVFSHGHRLLCGSLTPKSVVVNWRQCGVTNVAVLSPHTCRLRPCRSG